MFKKHESCINSKGNAEKITAETVTLGAEAGGGVAAAFYPVSRYCSVLPRKLKAGNRKLS